MSKFSSSFAQSSDKNNPNTSQSQLQSQSSDPNNPNPTQSKFGSSSNLGGWGTITPREEQQQQSQLQSQSKSQNETSNDNINNLTNNLSSLHISNDKSLKQEKQEIKNDIKESQTQSQSQFEFQEEQGEILPNTHFHENDGRDKHILSKHQLPLQYRWTLWHTAAQSQHGRRKGGRGRGQQGQYKQTWTTNYKKIASFDTVSTFWQLFNNIASPSMLIPGSSYHLFKGNVEPAWEDKYNSGGGSWTFRFESKGNNNNNNDYEKMINYAWYYTILNMIGNQFKYNDDICGVVISIRKNGRGKIELWMKNAKHRATVIAIGNDFLKFSGAKKRNIGINFISHQDNKDGRRDRAIDLPERSHDGYRDRHGR